MSAPGGIAAVQARMAAIQARIGAVADASGGALGATASVGNGEFAGVLAQAQAMTGGVVSTQEAWSIPWQDGAAPTARARATAASFGVTGATGATGDGSDAGALATTWPLRGRISQHYGPTDSVYSAPMTVDGVHYDHFHDGIDIAAPLGRDVHAIAAGTVEFAGRYPDGAEVVRIRHADGSVSLYAHLARDLDVKVGDKVAAGDTIGEVGMTGHTTGPHLHLELYLHGEPTDPEAALDKGRLPGTVKDTSVLPASVAAASAGAPTNERLAAFDRVAGDIPYAKEIRAAAVKAGIDPLLLTSLVKAESSFHADSVSYAGALGLCQLMPATAKAMHVDDPFDPAQNLRAGAKYLAHNLQLYGRVDLALAAYQAGKGAVAKAGGIPDSPTTHHYIDRILHSWAGYLEKAA